VTGTVSDESAVTVKVNGVDATVSGNSFKAVVPLALGANKITATAVDAFGNTSTASNTVNRKNNQAPVVDAGPDQTIDLPNVATLNGTVTDDGLPSKGALTITWSKVSGPGDVTFSDPSSAVTTASFSTDGVYVLRLTGDDSKLSSSDDVTVTVN